MSEYDLYCGLEWVITNYCQQEILLYLSLGADVNTRGLFYNNTAFIVLCQYTEYDEYSKKLLQNKQLNINAINYCGATALMYACQNGSEIMVKKILEHPEIDISIYTRKQRNILSFAKKFSNKSIVAIVEKYVNDYKNVRIAILNKYLIADLCRLILDYVIS